MLACPAAAAKSDEEKPHGAANGNGAALSEKSVALMNEGVGDCMAYRRRKGRFTILEWLFSIVLPILVILLGDTLPPAHSSGMTCNHFIGGLGFCQLLAVS